MALGQIGLSLSDFDALTPEEFDAVCHNYRQGQENRLHDAWERMRILATIVVQPFSKKKITAKTLLPFHWDRKDPTPEPTERSTRERFEKLVKELENNGKQ